MKTSVNDFVYVFILFQLHMGCEGVADNETYVTYHYATSRCLEDYKSALIPQHFMEEDLDVRKQIISQMKNMTAWISGQKINIGCMEGICYDVLKQQTHKNTRRPFICGTSILGFKSNVTYSEAGRMCNKEANVTVDELMIFLSKHQIEENTTMWMFNVIDIEGDNSCACIYEDDNYKLTTHFQPCDERMMGVCIHQNMISDYENSVILLMEARDIMERTSLVSSHITEQSTPANIIMVTQEEEKGIVTFSTSQEVQNNSVYSSSVLKRIEFLAFLAANASSLVILFFILILLWKRISRIERLANLNSKRLTRNNFLLDFPEHIYNSYGGDSIPKRNKKKKMENREDNKKHQYFKIPVDRDAAEKECQGFARDEENPYAELTLTNELKKSRDDLHNDLCVIDGQNNRASYIDMRDGMSRKALNNSCTSPKIDNKILPKNEDHCSFNLHTDVGQNGKKIEYSKSHGTLNTIIPVPSIIVDKAHLINKARVYSYHCGKSGSGGKPNHKQEKSRTPQLLSMKIGTKCPSSVDHDPYMEMRIPK